MPKSRIVQLVLILLAFAAGVVLFNSANNGAASESPSIDNPIP